MEKKLIRFIINPISGNSNQKKEFDKVNWNQYFDRKQFETDIQYTAYAGHALQLSKQAIEDGVSILVACGGDGTINEVASPLVGTDLALGLIPRGSGNGLLTHLKIPKKLAQALAIIQSGNTKSIDVGKVEDKFFLSNMGTGFAAQVISEYENLSGREFTAYSIAGWKAFNNIDFNDKYQLRDQNGNILYQASQVLVSNTNIMGYGVSVSPSASLVDGLLDVIAFNAKNKADFIVQCTKILLRRHQSDKNFYYAKSTDIILNNTGANKILIQLDGEVHEFSRKEIRISILPAALRIIAPESDIN